jgi:cytochrome c556
MSRLVRVSLFGTLALALSLLAGPVTRGADDDDLADIKEAQKVSDKLKKLIDAVADGKTMDLPELKKAVKDTTDLKHVMWAAYKPREKGGLGVGDKAGAIKPDGIEIKLINMGKKPLTAAQLEKEGPAIIQMAKVAQGMVEVVELNTPGQDLPKKPIADWKKFNKEQKDGAQDLIDAVNKNNPKAVQAAATKLYGSCTSCHGVFRPS